MHGCLQSTLLHQQGSWKAYHYRGGRPYKPAASINGRGSTACGTLGLYDGACLADADGDGVCDEDEVSGCTNENADNFNSSATDDDGTCVVSGCSDSDAVNYNPEATADDGSCEFAGCTDSSALN